MNHTTPKTTPRRPKGVPARLKALARMKPEQQLAAIRIGDFTLDEWSQAMPLAGRSPARLAFLALLDQQEQFDVLRDERLSLSEWCAFARRYPLHCVKLGDEFAFIAITTPEWCEQ